MREMKDSGIQCIDKILASWKITKLKYISNSIFRGQGITKEDVNINGDIQCVRYGEIYSKYSNSFSQCYSFINSNNLSPKQPFIKNGDIILAITGELIEEIGKNILYTGILDCAVGGDIVVVRLGIDADNRFINYALNSSYCQNQKSCNKFKLKVVHISSFEIGNILVLIPPLSIQKCIADFLDQKCSEIDALTADIQTQIETLEEYKKSAITEAVTKGLDPNVEMKDSGVEWIGKIPSNWTRAKIKNICSLIGSGTTPTSHNQDYYEGEINWIQSGDLYGTNIINNTQKKIATKALKSLSSLKIYKPPFISIAMYGASVGNLAVSTIEACCNQAVCCLKTNDNFVKNSFLFYWLAISKTDFLSMAIGGTQPNISQQKIRNQYIYLPRIEEQLVITDYLDQKCSEIDQTISEKKQQLETLAEYKKSLIYECVTGKKEIA